ncbi:MAG: VWA domain-containing protein [Bacteroidota bacterium]
MRIHLLFYGILLALLVACHSQNKSTRTEEVDVLEFDEDFIAIPRTAEPPPPPVITEIPEEEIAEGEEIEFVDQTIEEKNTLEISTDATVPPPPPPPPPPSAKEEEIFSVVEEMPRFPGCETEKERKKIAKKAQEQRWNTEDYAPIEENEFQTALDAPLSTFSIDVDKASYSNCRRYINNGVLPPPGAVRIEEFINYFDYDYPKPKGEHPFSIQTEMADCPWANGHKLVQIGLQGKEVAKQNMPASNLVFLLDVSGSMNSYNKLPLLKKAFRMLVQQLDAKDRVAIVVYAGASGVVLPSTKGNNQQAILEALNRLEAGGGTAGAAGIELAYQVAEENFIEEGNNRIILATDGDFNIGQSSDAALKTMIEEKRDKGIFLSVLGFGMGNYKDNKMETLADNGNGNYAYIDNLKEAKKVLVEDLTGTIFTIAKDVKIQIEFNPAHVKAYRLIGYENRKLKNEDFNNDKKDAGELGAGHTVTALYEIIPADSEETLASTTDELKYQTRSIADAAKTDPDWMTVKLRYKQPDADKSQLIIQTCRDEDLSWKSSSENFRFATAVAGFGLLLRDSEYKGRLKYKTVAQWVRDNRGKDEHGYRSELLQLVELAESLK